jgi:hypothetical protein
VTSGLKRPETAVTEIDLSPAEHGGGDIGLLDQRRRQVDIQLAERRLRQRRMQVRNQEGQDLAIEFIQFGVLGGRGQARPPGEAQPAAPVISYDLAFVRARTGMRVTRAR